MLITVTVIEYEQQSTITIKPWQSLMFFIYTM